MSTRYQIVLKEYVEPTWANWFGEMSVCYTEEGHTVITGELTDKPALHGLLDRIRDLNLTLISVTQIEPDTDNPPQRS